MARIPVVLIVLVSLAFVAGRWSVAEEEGDAEDALVEAQRYRILWVDSALELSHGGGRWVTELYLPELGIVATLVPESDEEGAMVPRLHVHRSDGPRNHLTGILGDPEPSEITVLRIPGPLAKAIGELAVLADRFRAEGALLGGALTKALGPAAIAGGD